MKTVLVCAIAGVMALPCIAVETFVFDIYDSGKECILRDNKSDHWVHYKGLESRTQVTRVIRSCSIDDAWQNGNANGGYENTPFLGQAMGQLKTNKRKTFNISPTPIANAKNSFRNGFSRKEHFTLDFDLEDLVCPGNSTLEVDGQSFSPVAVPAPGALVLAGIGTILVGSLRRRKAVS